jgi:tRNA-uridine 2-sulfurtransferase
VRVEFIAPQMAITPGQAVVFYREDTVIGGGTIIKQGDQTWQQQ